MLSICIPVYNILIDQQLAVLSRQVRNLTVEIIVIDDCSDKAIYNQNIELEYAFKDLDIRFIRNEHNLGRSKTRNKFLNYVKYRYLLFLDSGSIPIPNDFLLQYVFEISLQSLVAFGGSKVVTSQVSKEYKLRYLYANKCEDLSVTERSKKGGAAFLSGNFLIQKDVFKKNTFDESIEGYGYEDTVFGLNLENKGIKITHIDNAIERRLDTNIVFIEKTENALNNLYILSKGEYSSVLEQSVSLLKAVKKCDNYNLSALLCLLFKILKSPLRFLLSKAYLGVLGLQIYKLLFFLNIKRDFSKQE